MARIDAKTDRFLKKLGGDLKSEALSPSQVTTLSNAVAKLPADARVTSLEIDQLAKDLNLPSQHKATLIFALFFMRYGSLVKAELKDEKALSKGMASTLAAMVSRANKKDGDAVAEALNQFFASYASDTATIQKTGVELGLGAAPKLAVETDRVRVLGKAIQTKPEDITFSFKINGQAKGSLTRDEDGGYLYRNLPLDKLGPYTLYTLEQSLAQLVNRQPTKLLNTAVNAAYYKISEIRGQGLAGKEYFDNYYTLEAKPISPDAQRTQDAGSFVESGEGGWSFKRAGGKNETIPLGRMSIDTLSTLSTALSQVIRTPKAKGKDDTKQALAHARSISLAGSLLTEVARLLERKVDTEAKQRADSEAVLRGTLKNYRVAHIGAEQLNALVRAFR
jgi:hypothetical protein